MTLKRMIAADFISENPLFLRHLRLPSVYSVYSVVLAFHC